LDRAERTELARALELRRSLELVIMGLAPAAPRHEAERRHPARAFEQHVVAGIDVPDLNRPTHAVHPDVGNVAASRTKGVSGTSRDLLVGDDELGQHAASVAAARRLETLGPCDRH